MLRTWIAAAAACAVSSTASATWSIIIVDTRTGEVAVGSCTCLTGFDLQANTPVLLTGIGAATAQSSVDADGLNRVFIRDRFLEGVAPQDILAGLSAFDGQHQSRQYGFVDVMGRAATFSGAGAGGWKGGRTGVTGPSGTIAYAVQGNVLSGAPVVDRAVEAIENTPGDVAAKLMASMEAARNYGGDGRCSCSAGAPESCGPTPPSFTKASHIGYMLIARAGDRDGSNSVYRVSRTPTSLAAADFNGDGRLDIAAPGSIGNSVAVVLGREFPGGPIMYSAGSDTPTGAGPRDLAVADFNGDGKLDIATVNNTADSMSLLLGLGDGRFVPTPAIALGDGPVGVVTTDFEGDGDADLAAINNLSSRVSLLRNSGAGAFTVESRIVGGGPAGIALADEDGDGDQDLFIACSSARTVQVLRNEAGAFTAEPGIPVTTAAWSVAPADLDGDGDVDFAFIATAEAVVRVRLKGPGGYGPEFTYPVATQPWHVRAREMTGDGRIDLVVTSRGGRAVTILKGTGGGEFAPLATVPVGFQAQRAVIADLDDDGDDDIAVALPTNNGVDAIENFAAPGEAAMFQNISGCATGDYFMEFNVPFQMAADPDPVFTLRARYDAWRAGLIGVPDAVASGADLDRPVINAVGGRAVLTVRPLDWRGEPAVAAGVIVEPAAGPALGSIGAAVPQPDGSYTVEISAGAACGEAQLEVTVVGVDRTVRLMPSVALSIVPRADLMLDGQADFGDLLAFLNLLETGDARGDLNGDGVVDAADYQTFLDWLAAGC
ncbi:MAG: VCBS repeat-containing protein [Phycisphaerales bacterium]|nr:VCBS repeat-containing protein [Phycisphaerales bacterium]